MKIALDGGALCADHQYGTYRFSSEFLQAIERYDTQEKNAYSLLSFCSHDRQMSKKINFVKLTPSMAWMKIRVSYELYRNQYEVFIAVNQALPAYISGRSITISHGLSFLKYPTYYQSDYGRLYGQLQDYCLRSDHIIVSSDRIKQELLESQIPIHGQIHALPFGVPFQYRNYCSYPRKNWVLYVGSDQPVKQVEQLVEAFKATKKAGWKLVLCGVSGRFRQSDVFVYEHVSAEQLLQLYRQAKVYVSISLYESFNYPIVEALSQRCPVLALRSAVIPELQGLVTTVSTINEFRERLSTVIEGNVTICQPDDRIKQVCSWQRYVQKLQHLY